MKASPQNENPLIPRSELLSLALVGLMTLKDDLEDKIDSVSTLMSIERQPPPTPIAKLPPAPDSPKPTKRKLTAAGRKAIAAAQKARWAKALPVHSVRARKTGAVKR